MEPAPTRIWTKFFLQSTHTRCEWDAASEYWMISRGPGFLAVVWFGSSPTPFPPLPSAKCRSFSVFLCVADRAHCREAGEGGSQIILPPESLPGPLSIIRNWLLRFPHVAPTLRVLYRECDVTRIGKTPQIVKHLGILSSFCIGEGCKSAQLPSLSALHYISLPPPPPPLEIYPSYSFPVLCIGIRETRESWPLLTVETETNEDLWSTNEGGPSWGWFVGLVVPVQEIFILLWLLWTAQYKNIFSSPYTIAIYVSPSPSNLGRQSCRAACLWIFVSDWDSLSQDLVSGRLLAEAGSRPRFF